MVLKFLKSLYLSSRFFYAIFILALFFLGSYWWHPLYPVVWVGVFLVGGCFLGDIIVLYTNDAFTAVRDLPDKFSNSDMNTVKLMFDNGHRFPIKLEVIDEIPVQFQKRDFLKTLEIAGGKKTEFQYQLRPVERGIYVFGTLNCYVSTRLGLSKRRFSFQNEQRVKVYPSFVQMKKYDFLAIDNKISKLGLKKIRRLGHTMEFEQIKDYVHGDDIRTINWKATAKRGDLMVNQYQDEKSQPVYSIINAGRVMKMPFKGLKLLDYAINSTLAFSNIALKKNDKVGMLTYSNKVDHFVIANNRKVHLHRLLEKLYNIDTQFLDTDLGLLYTFLQRKVSRRSLIMLYTNFEHVASLKRQLPYLKAIARKHLLVVIFFENTELNTLLAKPTGNLAEIYDQTIAHQFKHDKQRMVKIMRQHGIQVVLTPPEELTVNTINKYIELKSRGLL